MMPPQGSRTSRAMAPLKIDPCEVTDADLKRIDDISALLLTFNDPRAGADVLSRHVQRIPVLKARIVRRFEETYPGRSVKELGQQIALLGNRQLEGILMELLEDIVARSSGA